MAGQEADCRAAQENCQESDQGFAKIRNAKAKAKRKAK
jgi:hypothetical protein